VLLDCFALLATTGFSMKTVKIDWRVANVASLRLSGFDQTDKSDPTRQLSQL